jgi:hypothetical protein
MNTPSDESEPRKLLPIVGIMLGTLALIVVFVILLYGLYVWLGPWVASAIVLLLIVAAFYGGARLWRRLGPEIDPPEDTQDADAANINPET